MSDTQPEEQDGEDRDLRVYSMAFRATPELRDALVRVARNQNRSVSQVVFLILDEWQKSQQEPVRSAPDTEQPT